MFSKKLLIGFITLCSFSLHSAAADSELIKTDVETWLDNPLKGFVEQTEMSPPEYCHFLMQSNPTEKFRCKIVQFQSKKYIILDKAESNPAMDLEKATSSDACDPEALEYSNNFWRLYFSYLNFSENKETFVSNTKEEREAARHSLDLLAEQPLTKFKQFLSVSTCRNARVASGLLLQFGNVCRTQAELSESLMLDSDWSIRNSATQCVGKWITSRDLETQKRLVDKAVKQMQLIHHTDRNKAIGLIMVAAARNKDIARYISKNYLNEIKHLGKIARIPNITGPVKSVLMAVQEVSVVR